MQINPLENLKRTQLLSSDYIVLGTCNKTSIVVPINDEHNSARVIQAIDRNLKTAEYESSYPGTKEFSDVKVFFEFIAQRFEAMKNSLVLPVNNDFNLTIQAKLIPPPSIASFNAGNSLDDHAVINIEVFTIIRKLFPRNDSNSPQSLQETLNHEVLHWTDRKFLNARPEGFAQRMYNSPDDFLLYVYLKSRTEGFTTIIENSGPYPLDELKKKLLHETKTAAAKLELFRKADTTEFSRLMRKERDINLNRHLATEMPFNIYTVGKSMFSVLCYAFPTDPNPIKNAVNIQKLTMNMSVFEFEDFFRQGLQKLNLGREHQIYIPSEINPILLRSFS